MAHHLPALSTLERSIGKNVLDWKIRSDKRAMRVVVVVVGVVVCALECYMLYAVCGVLRPCTSSRNAGVGMSMSMSLPVLALVNDRDRVEYDGCP